MSLTDFNGAGGDLSVMLPLQNVNVFFVCKKRVFVISGFAPKERSLTFIALKYRTLNLSWHCLAFLSKPWCCFKTMEILIQNFFIGLKYSTKVKRYE